MLNFFAEKMWVAFATHISSAKNIRILCIESAKTVKEMTLNELVKLTTLRTTGPCFFFCASPDCPISCTLCNCECYCDLFRSCAQSSSVNTVEKIFISGFTCHKTRSPWHTFTKIQHLVTFWHVGFYRCQLTQSSSALIPQPPFTPR